MPAACRTLIGIPHYVLDYESRFRSAVIDDFADAYVRGETPIPCVRCNQTVKFRDLLDVAKDLGAAALATGHYARRIAAGGAVRMYRAADPARDQSYFLFATTRAQLDFLRFPLGGLAKTEVRRAAGALDLAVADKPDSQDICFVPAGPLHHGHRPRCSQARPRPATSSTSTAGVLDAPRRRHPLHRRPAGATSAIAVGEPLYRGQALDAGQPAR